MATRTEGMTVEVNGRIVADGEFAITEGDVVRQSIGGVNVV